MSNILQEIEAQIAGVKTAVQKHNVGVVREISDGVCKIEGLSDCMANEMLDFGGERGWRPTITDTVATDGRGVDELWRQIVMHRTYLEDTGELHTRRAHRAGVELERVLAATLAARVGSLAAGATWDAQVAALIAGATDPYSAVDQLLA